MTTADFEFVQERRFQPILLALGVTPGRSRLEVGEHDLDVRFGPWRVRTPRDNIVGAQVTGPYRWWRAVGVRLSLADRGLTFGTSAERGVCIRFAEPVGLETARKGRRLRARHPGLTVTVDDPESLVRALSPADAS